MLKFFSVLLLTLVLFEPARCGLFWDDDTEETTQAQSAIEDAECDWSQDNEMFPDTTSYNQGVGAGTAMNPNGGGAVYGAGGVSNIPNGNTGYGGVAQYPNGAMTGYSGGNGNSGYAGEGYSGGATGSNIQNGNTGYGVAAQNPNGVMMGYSGGNGNSGYAGGGYVGDGSMSAQYNSPQSAQRFFPRQNYYFDENDYVALHPYHPIGSYVLVTNPDEEKQVVVQIVGRPITMALGRCLTLSKTAFAQIADLDDGVAHCTVQLTS